MAGYLQLTQTIRMANARIRTARELEARWKDLGPERQEEARAEWEHLKVALAAVRTRLEAGPRGFVRELSAAYQGVEAEPVAEPKGLGELARELQAATTALRDKLDAAADAAAARKPGPDAGGGSPAA